jgi:hypothetical protein
MSLLPDNYPASEIAEIDRITTRITTLEAELAEARERNALLLTAMNDLDGWRCGPRTAENGWEYPGYRGLQGGYGWHTDPVEGCPGPHVAMSRTILDPKGESD